MRTELKSYAHYKDSGIPWVGSVPSHWQAERAKRIFERMQRPVNPGDDVITCFRDGVVTLRKKRRLTGFTESLKEIGYQGVKRGDLVIHAMDAFAGAIGISDSDGKCTPVYAVCRGRVPLEARYYAYAIREMARTQYIAALARGIRERSTDFRYETLAALHLPVPPVEEQQAIHRYLDGQTGRIARLIRLKRWMIDLINEQKQAIIHQAVTRGLDTDARLKPSGVEWIGEIPEHWRTVRLRHLVTTIDQGISPQAEAQRATDGHWGVLKAGCVNGGVFRENENKRLPQGFPVDESIAVRDGDVLVSRASGSPRLVGSVGRVSALRQRLILSDKIFRLNPAAPETAEFLVYAMNTRYFRVQVEQAISGAEGLANNLPLSALKDFRIAIPPPEEAIAIAAYIRTRTSALEALASAADGEIDFLREYRTRLIADVVTGKLDVRGVDLPTLDALEPEDDLQDERLEDGQAEEAGQEQEVPA